MSILLGPPQVSQNAFTVEATSTTQQLRNVVVRVNFVVSGGFNDPSAPSAAVQFRGVAPTLTKVSAIYQVSGCAAWVM